MCLPLVKHVANFASYPDRSNTDAYAWKISGQTLDQNGNILANCMCHLFNSATDTLNQPQQLSDGGGNFLFNVGGSTAFYIVSYKAGSPDVAGTTVNTLVGV
jgi:hypothetical protein